MVSQLIATFLFIALHLGVSGTALRGRIIAAIGEKPYLALFSLASLGLLIWLSNAYAGADYAELWPHNLALVHVASLVMLFAVLLLVIGVTTRNPTSAGGEGLLADDAPPRGILSVTRHPVMWAIALWAIAHTIANGDVAAMLLFPSLGLLALVGPFMIDARRAHLDPEGWARFAARTSWLPFAAILAGRCRFDFRAIGWWRPLLGLALYGLVALWGHEYIASVPLFP